MSYRKPAWKGPRGRGHPPRPPRSPQISPDFSLLCLLPLQEELDACLPAGARLGRFIVRHPPPQLSPDERQELLLRLKAGEIPRASMGDAQRLLDFALDVLSGVGGEERRPHVEELKESVMLLRRLLRPPTARRVYRLGGGSRAAVPEVVSDAEVQHVVADTVVQLRGIIEHIHIEKGAKVTFVIESPPDDPPDEPRKSRPPVRRRELLDDKADISKYGYIVLGDRLTITRGGVPYRLTAPKAVRKVNELIRQLYADPKRPDVRFTSEDAKNFAHGVYKKFYDACIRRVKIRDTGDPTVVLTQPKAHLRLPDER